MRSISVYLVLALLLFGLSACNPSTLPDKVILHQGPEPENCGNRDQDRSLPYFKIVNPEINLGETITIDATCSLGRIEQIQWDFDDKSWSGGSPNNQWHKTEHIPFQQGETLNNHAAFLQRYTPTLDGTHWVRMKITDTNGDIHVVQSSYYVNPVLEENPIRPYVLLQYDAPLVDEPEHRTKYIPRKNGPVFLPWHNIYQDGGYKLLIDDEDLNVERGVPDHAYVGTPSHFLQYFGHASRGNIREYQWSFKGMGTVGTIVDTTTDLVSYRNLSRHGERHRVVTPYNLNPVRKTADGFVNTNPRYLPSTALPYDVEITLTATDSGGIEYKDSQTVRFVDPASLTTSIPQMMLSPRGECSYPEFDLIEGSSLPQFVEPRTEIDMSYFVLWRRHDLRGPIQIEFDSGSGNFETIKEIENTDYNENYKNYIQEAFRFTSPRDVGSYVAKLRVTDRGSEGAPNDVQVVEIPYQVRLPDPLRLVLTTAVPEAQAGEQVLFDARQSTSLDGFVAFEVFDENDVRVFYEPPRPRLGCDADTVHSPRVSENPRSVLFWSHAFDVPGTYTAKVTHYSAPEGTESGFDQYPIEEATTRVRIKEKPKPIHEVRGDASLFRTASISAYNKPPVKNPVFTEDEFSVTFQIHGLSSAADSVSWDMANSGGNFFDDVCDVSETNACTHYERSIPPWVDPGDEVTVRVRVNDKDAGTFKEQELTYRLVGSGESIPEVTEEDLIDDPDVSLYGYLFIYGSSTPAQRVSFDEGEDITVGINQYDSFYFDYNEEVAFTIDVQGDGIPEHTCGRREYLSGGCILTDPIRVAPGKHTAIVTYTQPIQATIRKDYTVHAGTGCISGGCTVSSAAPSGLSSASN